MNPSVRMTEFQKRVMEETISNTTLSFDLGLIAMVRMFGAEKIVTSSMLGGFDRRNCLIALRMNQEDAFNTKTMFHEMIHSTGDYLGRPMSLYADPGIKAVEEVIAEEGARMLMNFFGLNTPEVDERSLLYISRWTLVMPQSVDHEKCLKQASKAVQLILDRYIPTLAQEKINAAA